VQCCLAALLLEVISDDMSKSSRFVKKSHHGKCRRDLADSGDISPSPIAASLDEVDDQRRAQLCADTLVFEKLVHIE
jgi:hypothetical protein